jgi:hypothetical protein
MVALKRSEVRILDEVFDMRGGYVLNFSNATFAEFFEDEFGIDIYTEKYSYNGTSKAKYLRAFVETEDAYTVSRVLRVLWTYREKNPGYQNDFSITLSGHSTDAKTAFFDLLSRIEGAESIARIDVLERFKNDATLDELIAAIERDIQANKPSAALDRLHTYCMKKFAYLLDRRGVICNRDEPLHSRVGKYIKVLEKEYKLREISRRVFRSSISIFEEFNNIRNNESFAHDNDLVNMAEARFIFDSITSILRFVKTTEVDKFGA